ncbi:hypothetical protein ACHMW6_06250 [Pseudoduganella sp. UC29_106]|uniref:hypothetical protein n=1 Tax=Pseudoduganella sp. UC29_106 TaxID=3374553 RepID=UPI00375716BB
MSKVEVRCICCDKPFITYQGRVDRGESKYCSRACAYATFGYHNLVLAALPGTTATLAEKTKLSIDCVVDAITRMMRADKCYPTGLEIVPEGRGSGKTVYQLSFAAGPYPEDCDLPRTQREALATLIDRKIFDALPGTQVSIVEKTLLCPSTVSKLIRRMRARGECHIGRWKRAKMGGPVAVYKLGPGIDAVCNVEKLTNRQKYLRLVAKVTKAGKLDEHRATRAAYARARYVREHGDQVINALFGRPAERNREAA